MSAVASVEYKHNEKLTLLAVETGEQCPPELSAPVVCDAYRFVQSPVSPACFLPQGLKKPQRLLDARTHTMKCSLLGLSMFTDEASARARYLALKPMVKNIGKALGTHIARGSLDQCDGVATPASHSGHFDFFELSTAVIKDKFTVIGQL